MASENYVLLERIELNASAASVTFANIPQTGYTDLKVVLSTRTTDTTANDSTAIALQFNGDTASNYSRRTLYGDGGAVGSTSATTTSMRIGFTTTNGDTANTFGSAEFYVPNYTGSAQKSVSADAVTEANVAQYIYSALNAGLWTGTAAITSITVLTPSFSFLAGSTFSLYGLAALGTTPATAPKASGGNVIATDGTYWYHAFLASGTFTPAVGLICESLIVGGGGGANQGGGGAGGYRLISGINATSGVSNSIVIGAGGTGGDWTAGTSTSGVASSAFSYSSAGGGRGPGVNNNGVAGGSGSGSAGIAGGGTLTGGAGNTPSTSPSQGNNGGGIVSSSNNQGGAGGGGAGGAGSNAPATGYGGAGGAGSNSASSYASATSTGVSGYYAGGGGGGGNPSGGAGGSGGGGTGNGSNGTVNTGGGAGGAFGTGGAGGSGIIIVRYPIV